ncbi:hypothetical protein EF903_17970 [Streptomyces sp. WAC05292]|uniref:hypothetical protein n=1 Tax=Streptomyces sp. WAC05292 TaxID=2487418 RepID=UPI000F73FE79|nr:hypothetical protein [Streptomyces sp. WAC05292]RSS86999.1 hypothetical protein EF903_17970 [Streptomyces sp. WAC05292]
MNPYPGDTIEVGVTRTVTTVDTPPPPPRLEAADFAEKDTVLAMVAHWSTDELYTLGNLLMGEGDRRGVLELLGILRWLCEPNPAPADPAADTADLPEESPVVKVEFVTQEYEDGVFWSSDTIFLHRANGTVEDYEWPEDHLQDPEWEAKATRYEDLLADYSRSDHPEHGAHLIVTLATGEFTVTSKWSSV